MKNIIMSLFFLLVNFIAFGQNMGINTNNPHASAVLDVTSTTQGVLIPRMTQAQRSAISGPATGLLVYQTDGTPGFYFYNGSAWTALSGQSLPTQSGQDGKYLQTNGTTTSWKNTGTNLELLKVVGAAQSIAIGSSLTAPPVINFDANPSHPAGIPQTLTGGNTWTGDNLFTVGASGAGLYHVTVQLISSNTHVSPIIDVVPAGTTSSLDVYSYYGLSASYTSTSPVSYRFRGQIAQYVYLGVGDKLVIRGTNNSSALNVPLSPQYCKLQIVRHY